MRLEKNKKPPARRPRLDCSLGVYGSNRKKYAQRHNIKTLWASFSVSLPQSFLCSYFTDIVRYYSGGARFVNKIGQSHLKSAQDLEQVIVLPHLEDFCRSVLEP
jgi:hypothetical protein